MIATFASKSKAEIPQSKARGWLLKPLLSSIVSCFFEHTTAPRLPWPAASGSHQVLRPAKE